MANKNIFIIAGIALVIIVGGAIFFLTRVPESQPLSQPEVKQPLEQKEFLTIEQDLTPIELSQEERQALKDEGFAIPSGEDALAKDLQSVRSSDELDAIEADLNETNLSGLDFELEAIESDLQGL